MKQFYKYALITLLVCLCALAFIGCNGGSGDNVGGDNGGKKQAVQLSAPANLQISGSTLTWNAVDYAAGYSVNIDGSIKTTNIARYNLISLMEPKTYIIQVMAKGDGTNYSDSSWSAVKPYTVEVTLGLDYKVH